MNPFKAKASKRSRLIKYNPYEQAEVALDLVAKIASAQPATEFNKLFNRRVRPLLYGPEGNESISTELEPFSKFFHDNRALFDAEPDFLYKLRGLLDDLLLELKAHENTNHTQIVVAGGFSSGKSTFLNQLTNSKGLLPTSFAPSSTVITYLYCSEGLERECVVRGVNQKQALVPLSRDVLKAIHHGAKSNVHLASVLDKLFIEVKTNEKLDRLVFVDTPGYNNPSSANVFSQTTDEEKAKKALRTANVLFWLIDSEMGCIPANDIEIISSAFEGDIVFVFTKAERKTEAEIECLIEKAITTLEGSPIGLERCIDALAYSSLTQTLYCSYNAFKSLDELLDKVRSLGSGCASQQRILAEIQALFYSQIGHTNERITQMEADRNEWIDERSTETQSNLKHKGVIKDFKKDLEEIFEGASLEATLDLINIFIDESVERDDRFIQSYDREIERIKSEIKQHKEFVDLLAKYAQTLQQELDLVKAEIELEKKKLLYMNQAELPETAAQSVFECIDKSDYNAFRACFTNGGLDVSQCNKDGFNVLNYAIQSGNNEMVRFLLAQGASPELQDARGYNAMHTAVEYQYRDMCEILIEDYPALLESKTRDGETIQDLSRLNMHRFHSWIETK